MEKYYIEFWINNDTENYRLQSREFFTAEEAIEWLNRDIVYSCMNVALMKITYKSDNEYDYEISFSNRGSAAVDGRIRENGKNPERKEEDGA